ncbi:hypothetical protein ACVIU7_008165 [Bradyrhizobium liaoningense]|uniref:Uncharacterized protein n=2 Tax=Bradyrhizobium TaxID=374 RepID=A0A562QW39_9BRAD|nr:hypothetical protein [Bradyrhizobium japonicum]TWH95340.1 hypothetical protein IQ17_06621 [Bradyrhizobium daqingense]TWI60853.1 hypothetical protein IQ16_07408 [Bradyrhizobium huanghuaihaiense]MCP1776350.1 hypothetical protein [Bradyrhizobium japonicum]MCP1897370.1 hypothetical protein [Bradyrhizobium japonicum]
MANHQQDPLCRELIRDCDSLPRVAGVVSDAQYSFGIIGKLA